MTVTFVATGKPPREAAIKMLQDAMALVSFIIWKAIERTNYRFQSRGDDT